MWKVNGRRTPSDGKSSHCLWHGELKIKRAVQFKFFIFNIKYLGYDLHVSFNIHCIVSSFVNKNNCPMFFQQYWRIFNSMNFVQILNLQFKFFIFNIKYLGYDLHVSFNYLYLLLNTLDMTFMCHLIIYIYY
jgi:hypothetical protein